MWWQAWGDPDVVRGRDDKQQRSAIEDVVEQLDYRLPTSHRPMSNVVLSRTLAERLVKEWRDMQARVEERKPDAG
jgi:hypothetical protein